MAIDDRPIDDKPIDDRPGWSQQVFNRAVAESDRHFFVFPCGIIELQNGHKHV